MKEVAQYDYTDEHSELLYQVIRYEPKEFRQRRPSLVAGWQHNLNGVRRVLYHLPEVVDAIEAGRWIFLCEGEKDVDNMREAGFTATTNCGGTGGSNKFAEQYGEQLRGSYLCILPDKDEAGHKRAAKIATALHSITRGTKIVKLPVGEKQDATDWLDLCPKYHKNPVEEIASWITLVDWYIPPPPPTIEKPERRQVLNNNADWQRKVEYAASRLMSDFVEVNGKHMALCPFHADKNPSMAVKGNLWYCHACAEGGTPIQFIKRRDGLEFADAVKALQ